VPCASHMIETPIQGDNDEDENHTAK
jgi:hypothetical protein